jgi:uncharacterized membrane protein
MLALRLLDILNITLAALVCGIFWGPWLALTRSMRTFTPEVFLPVVHRLDQNLGRVMQGLFPIALLSFVPVLVLDVVFGCRASLILGIVAFALFVLALVVTMVIEVPIVKRIRGWTLDTMPADWQAVRDRWVSYHLLRVIPGIAGVALLVAGALWQR